MNENTKPRRDEFEDGYADAAVRTIGIVADPVTVEYLRGVEKRLRETLESVSAKRIKLDNVSWILVEKLSNHLTSTLYPAIITHEHRTPQPAKRI